MTTEEDRPVEAGGYPFELSIGREPYKETLTIRPGELLIAFREGVDDARIADVLVGHKVIERHREDMLAERLASQSLRWVRVEDGVSARDTARAIHVSAGGDVWLASPVYVPGSSPVDAMAAAPEPGTFIVQPPTDPEARSEFGGRIAKLGLEVDPDWPEDLAPLMRLRLVRGIPDDGFDRIQSIRDLGAEDVEFDWLKIDPLEYVPHTTYWPKQTNLVTIGMPSAWEVSRGDPDVVVAVIDLAFDVAHPDLIAVRRPKSAAVTFSGGSQPSSYDAQVDMTPTPAGRATTNDAQWHGTAVAGIIGARHGAGSGVAGIAPDCSLMLVRVKPMLNSNVASAIPWMVRNGARVINFSVSSAGPSIAMEGAVSAAWTGGAVICAAAGTGAPPEPEDAPIVFPAGFREVIAVGACMPDGSPKTLAVGGERWFSKYQTTVRHEQGLTVLAPGIHIPSLDASGEAGYNAGDKRGRKVSWFHADYTGDDAGDPAGLYVLPFTGTSAATPQVSGLAALLFSVHLRAITNGDVRRIIEKTCEPVGGSGLYTGTGGTKGWSRRRGYGRVNAAKALQEVP